MVDSASNDETVRRERLIQEELLGQPDYPWRMLVACILLNRTRGFVVRPVLARLLELGPPPEALSQSDHSKLVEVIRPLGFKQRRSGYLRHMSRQYLRERRPETMSGIGDYALESWMIFVEGFLDFEPSDAKLKAYVDWKKRRMTNGG